VPPLVDRGKSEEINPGVDAAIRFMAQKNLIAFTGNELYFYSSNYS